MGLTFFDFCSGIGGGRLGLEKSGMEPVGYADTSRLSVTTYCILFNEEISNNFGNIKKIDIHNLPNFDVLMAGFPCQSFSVIGNQKGFSDPRGQIIFNIANILSSNQPKFFLLENVRGLVTHDKGESFRRILNLLIEQGYHVEYKILNSLNYGVPQMRQRVFLVGIRNDLFNEEIKFEWPKKKSRKPLSNFLISENNIISDENYERLLRYLDNEINKEKYEIKEFLNEEYLIIDTRMSDLRLYRERVPALRSHRDGILYVKGGVLRELTGYEALLLQGFPIKLADKVEGIVTNRHLLKQAGNAMTVDVVESIGKGIIKYYNQL